MPDSRHSAITAVKPAPATPAAMPAASRPDSPSDTFRTGAPGALCTGIVTRATGFDCCYSYRDPGAANSLAVYLDSPGFLEALAGSGEDLTGLIIGAVSAFEPLLGVRARGLAEDENYFRGFTPETLSAERRELLSAGAEALGAVAAKLRAAFENNGVCVLAPRAELERCGLDEILSL